MIYLTCRIMVKICTPVTLNASRSSPSRNMAISFQQKDARFLYTSRGPLGRSGRSGSIVALSIILCSEQLGALDFQKGTYPLTKTIVSLAYQNEKTKVNKHKLDPFIKYSKQQCFAISHSHSKSWRHSRHWCVQVNVKCSYSLLVLVQIQKFPQSQLAR